MATTEHKLQRADAAIMRALASAGTLEDAFASLLTTLGDQLGWDTGGYWRVDPVSSRLVLARHWTAEGHAFTTFWDNSFGRVFERGVGLPGEAWATGKAVWMPTLSDAARFPRHDLALAAGLRSGIAFPVLGEGGDVLGVMEFFARRQGSALEDGVHVTKTLARELPQLTRRIAANDRIQRSEARLNAMLQTALDAIIWMDSSGLITGWNAAAERTFGYSSEEAVGQSLGQLIVPARLRAAHQAGLARFLTSREATVLNRRVEVPAIDKSGREFPVELSITCVATAVDLHFVGYVRDISDHKALEAERQRLLAEAQEATRTRDQLLAVVSHDLRNSLNAVVISASTLQMMLARLTIEDRLVPRTVETILRAATQMRHLIGDLLDAAVLQSGRVSLTMRDENLQSMLYEAVDLHQALAQEKGVSLATDALPKDVQVAVDRARLMQVLSNLLGNAIKFCSPGDAIIVRAHADNDHQACIEVSDTGPGIASDALPHIFEPHWSGDLPGKGTGLGLFISRRLIEAHGGTITATPNEERGVTMTCCLPLKARGVQSIA